MKKRIFIIALVTLFLAPTLFSNTITASAQTYGSTLAGINGTSFSAVAQAAEDSLQSGGSLEIAAGNYVSDGSVIIKSNTKIFGHGEATFIQQKGEIATHTSMFVLIQSSNVEIYNLWLDGNRVNQFDIRDEMRHGIAVSYSTDIWVHNMKITNFTETGYNPAWSKNCTINNSRLTGSGDGDIWIDIDSTNMFVFNNTCDSIHIVDFGGNMSNVKIYQNIASFIEVYQGDSGSPHTIDVINNTILATPEVHFALYIQGCQNVTIKGNVISGFSSTTCWVGMQISSGKSHTIIENKISNCNIGIKSDTNTNSTHLITRNDLQGNITPILDNTTLTLDVVMYNLGVDISSWDEIS
jgi:hypothetical protein